MTDEQGLALAQLARDRPVGVIIIKRTALDRPGGYISVSFAQTTGEFNCGIAPNGSVSW